MYNKNLNTIQSKYLINIMKTGQQNTNLLQKQLLKPQMHQFESQSQNSIESLTYPITMHPSQHNKGLDDLVKDVKEFQIKQQQQGQRVIQQKQEVDVQDQEAKIDVDKQMKLQMERQCIVEVQVNEIQIQLNGKTYNINKYSNQFMTQVATKPMIQQSIVNIGPSQTDKLEVQQNHELVVRKSQLLETIPEPVQEQSIGQQDKQLKTVYQKEIKEFITKLKTAHKLNPQQPQQYPSNQLLKSIKSKQRYPHRLETEPSNATKKFFPEIKTPFSKAELISMELQKKSKLGKLYKRKNNLFQRLDSLNHEKKEIKEKINIQTQKKPKPFHFRSIKSRLDNNYDRINQTQISREKIRNKIQNSMQSLSHRKQVLKFVKKMHNDSFQRSIKKIQTKKVKTLQQMNSLNLQCSRMRCSQQVAEGIIHSRVQLK